ncbi:MAG TPA: hypothetical protein VGI39_11695 [Polyangiaceae bacterium]
MRSVIGNAIVLGLVAAVATSASMIGCSNGSGATSSPGQGSGNEATGSLGLQLTLPGGLQVNTVSYTINGPHTYTGTVDVSAANTISFVVPNVAAGSGYTITLTATTTDGSTSCVGTSAPFTVAAQQTTAVTVFLQCTSTAGSDAGAVLVNGVSANCATWTSAVANPATTTAGGTITLTAAATGPAPSALTYGWSAPTGTFSAASAATSTFTCPATPGTVTITLVVGDGPIPTGATCPAAASTTSLTVTCGSSTVVDAGTDSGSSTGTDAGADTGADTGSTAPLAPCTSAGQANCVACSGSAGGLCSATQALFVQKDITGGQVTGTTLSAGSCYSCLLNAGCLDDVTFNDQGNECSDVPATSPVDAGSSTEAQLCLNTISCVVGSQCASSDVSICFCGPTNAGNACQTAANPNGACFNQEVTGLGTSVNATVLKNYTDKTRPAGMANQIFACAEVNSCAACTN